MISGNQLESPAQLDAEVIKAINAEGCEQMCCALPLSYRKKECLVLGLFARQPKTGFATFPDSRVQGHQVREPTGHLAIIRPVIEHPPAATAAQSMRQHSR